MKLEPKPNSDLLDICDKTRVIKLKSGSMELVLFVSFWSILSLYRPVKPGESAQSDVITPNYHFVRNKKGSCHLACTYYAVFSVERVWVCLCVCVCAGFQGQSRAWLPVDFVSIVWKVRLSCFLVSESRNKHESCCWLAARDSTQHWKGGMMNIWFVIASFFFLKLCSAVEFP